MTTKLAGSALAALLSVVPVETYRDLVPRLPDELVTGALRAATPPLGPLVERAVAYGDPGHRAALRGNPHMKVRAEAWELDRGENGLPHPRRPIPAGEFIGMLRGGLPDAVLYTSLLSIRDTDWDTLLAAHRAEPFARQNLDALLHSGWCPRRLLPEFLRGHPVTDKDRFADLCAAYRLGAADRLRYVGPAYARLEVLKSTLQPLRHAPWVRPEDGSFAALLALDLPSVVGGDPRAWLRLVRLARDFRGTVPELAAAAAADGPVPRSPDDWTGRWRRNPVSLLLFLAPPHVAARTALMLSPREQERLMDPLEIPAHPRLRAAPGWDPSGYPLMDFPQLVSRTAALTGLAEPLTDISPDRQWALSALHGGLITGADLIATAHPLSTALKLLGHAGSDNREILDSGTAELRRAIRSLRNPEALVVMATLIDEFPGTLPELLDLAGAVAGSR